MSIEDLMNIKVTSVSRTEQKLSRTASAVFVINQEAIRQSGAQSIPDLLRMVPGMDVAQITANAWAIGTRGLNSRFSNKLLVLLDGRRVYTPTFGGVFWDVVDVPMEDIERIEVIRGPGASVWGANAVNGVINIITKNAGQTNGGLITTGGGNLDQGFGTVQYGGSLDKGKHDYRIYTKYQNDDHLPNAAGQDGGDGWHLLDGGFRTDSTLSEKDGLMTQGNLYTGQVALPEFALLSFSPPTQHFVDLLAPLSGGYVQSVWNHAFSSRSDTSLQGSYDTYERDDELREGRNTLTVDFQHHIALRDRQDVRWGFTYVYTSSRSNGSLTASLRPPDLEYSAFSSFLQDEIALIPDQVYLTIGVKAERNNYTGWTAMPSARLAWQANQRNMFWAAFSSAVRTPDELDAAFRVNFGALTGPGGIPVLVGVAGNPNYQNEGLAATEAGYRTTFSSRISLDIAAYYNHYTHQQTTEPITPFLESTPPPLHLAMLSTFENLMHGETHGLEISSNWKMTNRWTLSSGYAFEGIAMRTEPASQDTTSVAIAEGASPRNSAQVRSAFDLLHGLEWDASAYFVGRLASGNIPAYTRIDTQLTWNWSERSSFSVVGQNLQQDHHFEFQDFTGSVLATQAKRSAYAMIKWRF